MSDFGNEENGARQPDFHEDGASVSMKVDDVVRISLFIAGVPNLDDRDVSDRIAGLRVDVPAETVNAVKKFVFGRSDLRDTDLGRRILYSSVSRNLSVESTTCGFDPGN